MESVKMRSPAGSRWQVQQAKHHLSQLLQASVTDGPQVISRHGQELAVVLSVADYSKLLGGIDFKDFLSSHSNGPDLDILEIVRSKEIAPIIELD